MGSHEFNSLLLSNADHLKPFAFQLTRNKEEAEDLYQETMYKALAYREKFASGTNIKAWMYTIMRYTFINEYRKSERKQVLVNHFTHDLRNQNDTGADQYMRLKEIRKALQNLPVIFREASVLYLEGYKYTEIATKLNEPVGTIKSRIHFARRMLRKQIER